MSAAVELGYDCHACPECGCPRCTLAMAAWNERGRLLAVARRRTSCEAEAQDVVSEAIARALESETVEIARIGQWLTAVTMNLCADLGRDRRRQRKRVQFAVQHQVDAIPAELAVLDRVAAKQLTSLLTVLPKDQHLAVSLRADGHPVAEIAARMQVSVKAAESLLSRARTMSRSVLKGALGVICALVATAKKVAPSAASMATAALVVALALPSVGGHMPAGGHPASPHLARDPNWGLATVDVRSAPSLSHRGSPADENTVLEGRSSSSAHSTRYVRQPVKARVGPVRVRNDGSGIRKPHETFVQSVETCLSGGVEVSAAYIGCKESERRPAAAHAVG